MNDSTRPRRPACPPELLPSRVGEIVVELIDGPDGLGRCTYSTHSLYESVAMCTTCGCNVHGPEGCTTIRYAGGSSAPCGCTAQGPYLKAQVFFADPRKYFAYDKCRAAVRFVARTDATRELADAIESERASALAERRARAPPCSRAGGGGVDA